MREITKKEMEALVNKKIIINTNEGYKNKFGSTIGFYRTRNKRYIEDKYADIAKKLQ